MKNLLLIITALFTSLSFTSCNKDEDDPKPSSTQSATIIEEVEEVEEVINWDNKKATNDTVRITYYGGEMYHDGTTVKENTDFERIDVYFLENDSVEYSEVKSFKFMESTIELLQIEPKPKYETDIAPFKVEYLDNTNKDEMFIYVNDYFHHLGTTIQKGEYRVSVQYSYWIDGKPNAERETATVVVFITIT